MRLFHLVRGEDWDAHRASGATSWSPASLASEGFVHLSEAHQLAGTLAVHFADCERAWLFEIETGDLGDGLKHEPSRDGALFPHLYRPIRHTEVLRAWELLAGTGGLLAPLIGPDAGRDLPEGGPAPL